MYLLIDIIFIGFFNHFRCGSHKKLFTLLYDYCIGITTYIALLTIR